MDKLPGVIIVGTHGPSNNHNRITTDLEYRASINQPSTNYSIDFLQQGKGKSPEIVIFLCGAVAINPNFTDYSGDGTDNHTPVVWYSASQFDGYAFEGIAGFIFPDQCIYTSIPLVFDAASENSGAVLIGHSGPPPSRVSGAGIIYAWPGILALPESDSISDPSSTPPLAGSDFTVNPLTKESSYTVTISDAPDDISNVVTNPGLTSNPWGFEATESFNNSFTGYYPEFRLSGDLSDSQAASQRNLFIAGALVGVAGGAVIWLLELLTKILLAPRSSSETSPSEKSTEASGELEKEQAVFGQHDKGSKSPSGLGWPGQFLLSDG